MRKLLGYLILILGVVGLGFWARGHNAVRMEEDITARAGDAAAPSVHGAQTRVSGRDITISGLADSAEERDALVGALDALDGRRVVHDELTVITHASPYRFDLTKGADGALGGVAGHVPSELARGELADLIGADPAAALELASGAPAPGWNLAVGAGLGALAELDQGAMSLTDGDLTVTGVAADAAHADAARAALDSLPEGYRATAEISIPTPPEPGDWSLSWSEGAAPALSGVLPAGLEAGDLAATLGAGDLTGEADARGNSDPAEAEAARAAVAALAPALPDLRSFDLAMTGLDSRVSVLAKPGADTDAIRAALSGALPEGADLSVTALEPVPGDWSLVWTDVDGGRLDGTLPSGLSAADLAGALSAGDLAGTPDAQEASDPAEAAAGRAAVAALAPRLPELSAFALSMKGLRAQADVTAKPGADTDAIAADLAAALPQDAEISVTAPLPNPDYRLRYDAAKGGTLEGVTPEGLDAASVAGALGLSAVTGETAPGAGGADARDAGLATLSAFRGWMPQIETLAVDIGPAPRAEVVLGAGSDLELIEGALSETLGDDMDLSVSASGIEIAEGTERVNAATGETERFIGGFWLPKRDFTPDVATCNDLAQDILDRFGIGFVTGSARLNAEAAHSVNELAAVMGPCAQAGLSAELGGHTDSTGNADLNRQLSQDRAQAVYDALTRRGVPAAAMSATGYGADQPIADNATEEGRAQNRRTTVTWTN